MHVYRNEAEYRDGHTGVFGCDEISPEGKAGQERGSPAVGHTKGGSAKTRGSDRTPLLWQPPAPLARLMSSSPKLSKVSAATKLTCPWPNIISRAPRRSFRETKETEIRAKIKYKPMQRLSPPPG